MKNLDLLKEIENYLELVKLNISYSSSTDLRNPKIDSLRLSNASIEIISRCQSNIAEIIENSLDNDSDGNESELEFDLNDNSFSDNGFDSEAFLSGNSLHVLSSHENEYVTESDKKDIFSQSKLSSKIKPSPANNLEQSSKTDVIKINTDLEDDSYFDRNINLSHKVKEF